MPLCCCATSEILLWRQINWSLLLSWLLIPNDAASWRIRWFSILEACFLRPRRRWTRAEETTVGISIDHCCSKGYPTWNCQNHSTRIGRVRHVDRRRRLGVCSIKPVREKTELVAYFSPLSPPSGPPAAYNPVGFHIPLHTSYTFRCTFRSFPPYLHVTHLTHWPKGGSDF